LALGVKSDRQQYFPIALSPGVVVPVTVADVPVPFAPRVTAEPTWVPFLEQSPPFAVTVAGEQRKNLTEPAAGADVVPTVT
jgi:hypothetical protein